MNRQEIRPVFLSREWAAALMLPLIVALLPSNDVAAAEQMSYSQMIEQLTSPKSGTRKGASQDLFGQGVRYKPIYDYLERLVLQAGLEKKLTTGTSSEIEWHMKALASSGSAQYLDTLKLMKSSQNEKVAKYAENSLQILQTSLDTGLPYIDPEKVRLINGTDLFFISARPVPSVPSNCAHLKQSDCKTTRDTDKCIAWHRSRAAALGADTLLIVSSKTLYHAFSVGTQHHTTTSTLMAADYYSCYSSELIDGEPIPAP